MREHNSQIVYIHSEKTYFGMFGAKDPVSDLEWVNKNIRFDHGPLCEIYPRKELAAQESAKVTRPHSLWLISANRGLNDPDDPTQESLGRTIQTRSGYEYHFVDGPGPICISKWRKDFQEEFAQRADWCRK